MGAYENLASRENQVANLGVGVDKSSRHQLRSQAVFYDPPVVGELEGTNSQNIIPEQTSSGVSDTYTLTLSFNDRLSHLSDVTTAAIDYDETAFIVSAEIADALGNLFLAGFDIQVTESGSAGLSDGTLALDWSNSYGDTEITCTMTPTGWTQDGTITNTVGEPQIAAAFALLNMNVVAGTAREPSTWTRPATNGQTRPRRSLIMSLGLMVNKQLGNEEATTKLEQLYPKV